MDSVSPGLAELNTAAIVRDAQDPVAHFHGLCGISVGEFWHAADAGSIGLSEGELAQVLIAVGLKCNYGLPAEVIASRAQVIAFWRALHLPDLALAHACAMGRDLAWQQFIDR